MQMQTVLDSLCRCFGSPVQAGDLDRFDVQPHSTTTAQHQSATSAQPAPATPDAKRRTKNMKLQEEQWDALFDCNAASNAMTGGNCGEAATKTPGKPPVPHRNKDLTVEQAQAVAKAKLAANGGGGGQGGSTPSQSRRKRATPEDIFRSKKNQSPPGVANSGANQRSTKDAFSRFLTNHPVLANSLCFATPIRDSTEEPDGIPDSNSVVSDTNTLNTAEDTITSTLYYEQVKLAGLKQKNPPMPLFGAYEVKPSDDIRKVAHCESYSSTKMKDWVRQNPEMLKVEPLLESEKTLSPAPPKTTKKRMTDPTDDDDEPPDMVNSSSESTGRSV